MIRKILVALDGSSASQAVLPIAGYIAQAGGYELTLLAVWEMGPQDAETLGPRTAEALRAHGAANMRSYLDNVARSLEEQRGLKPAIEVRAGHPAIEIMDAAAHLGSDLIAMATHGRRGATAATRGSVADKLLRGSKVPVLAVGPLSLHGIDPAEVRIERILAPLDGTSESESALPIAAELARGASAEIHLLRVVPPILSDYGTGLPEWYEPGPELDEAGLQRPRQQEAARYLSVVRERYERFVKQTHVRTGRPADEIRRVIEDERLHLVVMASRSRGEAAWTLGGVANEIIEGPVPVVIVQPGSVAAD